MDPFDRLHKVITGLGGGVQAVPGLVWDLARAPFVDDDVDGILGTINATVVSRVGQAFGNLFGPEEGLGAVIGGLPGREHLRGPIGGINQALEAAYREGVAEPLSTAFTAGSLAASPTFLDTQGRGTGIAGQLSALVDVDTWRKADEIAESRSWGQALALTFGTKDILDQEEVERFAGTDAYQTASGTFDALGRLFLSPDVLTAKAGTAYRAGRLTAARGGRLGTVAEVVPPQIGRRAERVGSLALGRQRIVAINNTIDRAYLRMPRSLQRLVGSERQFGPEDLERLERFEATRRELATATLEDAAMRTSDPARVRVLQNVARSRRTREVRAAGGRVTGAGEVRYGGQTRSFGPSSARTGEVPVSSSVHARFAAARQADIDAYFAAANTPQPRGFFSGITRTPGWRRVDDLISRMPENVDVRAGLIHDRLFPTHHRGDIISRYLAEASGPAERESVMRVFLGDMRALEDLERSSYAFSRRLLDLVHEQAVVRADPILRPLPHQLDFDDFRYMDIPEEFAAMAGTSGVTLADEARNTEARLARIGEEISEVVDEGARLERLSHAFRSLPAGPALTRAQAARNTVKSSTLYQTSLFGKGVRLFTDMRPHHLVDSHDPAAPAQLARMLREAGFDDTAIAQARGQFDALDPHLRGQSLERWVERVERRILKDNGLDKDEIRAVIHEARIGRNEAQSYIRGSRYDGAGRARVQIHDGDEILDIELPLSVTQLENVVVVPNFHRLRRHAARYARLKYGDDWRSAITQGVAPAWTVKEYGLDGLRGIMEVWRPLVLLRPAWTFRVIGDETLRQVAKFGALVVALEARRNINNYGAALKTNPIVRRVLRTDDVAKAARRGTVAGAAAGGAIGGPLGVAAGGALGNRLVRRMADLEEAGYVNVRFGGHSISGPFGDAGSTAEVYRTLNSARASVDELLGVHENRWYGALRRDPTRWRTHTWGVSDEADVIYRQEWARNLRRQVAQDEMGRQFLAGKGVDEVLDWLDNTLAGRRYAARVPWRSDRRSWVETYADHIESYTAGDDAVKRGILAAADDPSDAKVGDLLDLIPEELRAPIHGAETDQLVARGPLNQAINAFVDNAFDILGTTATDHLSRNPTFARFYQAEARRLFAGLEPGDVPESLIRKLEGQARDFALRETRELLYDMAEQSRIASMTRLLIPFYPAWQEVLTRWAGLAVENPIFATRAREVWLGPDRAGWTYTDDRGDTFLRLRIPEFAKDIVNQGMFASALDSQGHIFLDKRGFNLVAQGTPGFGPFVQIAVSDMVEQVPALEDSVRFILPFGPVDPFEGLLPPTVKRAIAASGDEEGAARANAAGRILTTKLAQMETGDIPEVNFSDPAARAEFLRQVDDEVNQLMKLRLFSGFVAPVAPLYESPYKPYVEIYRALRDGDWERAREVGARFDVPGAGRLPSRAPRVAGSQAITADDIFLDVFGEEFFALTQAFTETVDGVPPTVEGLEASERYGHLIAAYPEWGGVIAGYDGGGTAVKFSRAVYDRQMAAGSRRRLGTDEILDSPDRRLGWSTYSRYMDLIDMVRVSRGLPNLQVRGAEDLRKLKQALILGLAAKHPAWYEDYGQTDRNAWAKRIEGARRLADEPDLARRPDISGLDEYLRARDQILALLAARTSQSLTATSNQDLARLWQTMVGAIVERNPEFADLYYRKLENDPVTPGGATLVSDIGRTA